MKKKLMMLWAFVFILGLVLFGGNYFLKNRDSEEVVTSREFLKNTYNITKYEDEMRIETEPSTAEMFYDILRDTDYAMSTLGYELVELTKFSDATELKYRKIGKEHKINKYSQKNDFNQNMASQNQEKRIYEQDSRKISYETYYNPRFKFSVDYPTEYFKFLPDSLNGDGKSMLSEDNQAYLSFSAIYNALDTTIEEEYNSALNSHDSVVYKKLGKTSYSLSYYGEHGKIVFEKKIYDKVEDKYITLYFEYEEKYKDFMSPIIERMANSVR